MKVLITIIIQDKKDQEIEREFSTIEAFTAWLHAPGAKVEERRNNSYDVYVGREKRMISVVE